MKPFFLIVLSAATIFSSYSCRKVTGSGPVVTEIRQTGSFDEVTLDVPGELLYVPADKYEVTIQAQQNILDVIQTQISGQELKIRVRNNTHIGSHENIRITVKSPAVHSFTVNGSGEIRADNIITNNEASLEVSGSGKIVVALVEAAKLETEISGSGEIRVLDGTLTQQEVEISGSGNVDTQGALSTRATTSTSGSGTIRLSVTDLLNANISGSGQVYYKGNPTVNTQISGSGKVVRVN